VQVKNGPIDFMPREPFHPLFGAMKQTPLMAELQVTQEYLGHSNHLVFLASMWKEFLDSPTGGPTSPVARTFENICAVANTGDDANWCGHHFAQANWYAFGRLAWDPDLSGDRIADEWIRQTFTNDTETVATIQAMMLSSWETFVSYSMPLGLHHLISGTHYAPAPWNGSEPRADWTAVYYHQANAKGIGFDRTMRGDGAVGQYFPAVRDKFDDVETCPEKFLLWFHHLPWDYRMSSGRSLLDEIAAHYKRGANEAMALQATWVKLQGKIDPQRYQDIAAKLAIQATDAQAWRDQCIAYFRTVAGASRP
jgi:alpha-glucuronidase